MERKLITGKDAILLGVIVFIALMLVGFGAIFKAQGETAVVSVDGKVVKEIILSDIHERTDFKLENGVVISAENGKVRFFESSCKNKYCIGTGELSKAGEVAVCVPTKTVITISGAPDGADVITY